MASIGSLASTYRGADNPYRNQQASAAQADTRERDLTQRLDAQLTNRVTRIREQISPPDHNGAVGTNGVGGSLDIRA